MSPIITQKSPWTTKFCENILLEKLNDDFGIIDRAGNGFHLLGGIVYGHKYVQIVVSRQEQTYEVNSLHIKYFHHNNSTFRNLIELRNIRRSLTSLACDDKLPSILEKSGLI